MRCAARATLFLLLLPAACRGTSPPPAARAAYVGADACATCHQEITGRWKASGHGNAGSLASERTVKGDFQHKNVYVYKGVTSRMSIRNGKYFMQTQGADGSYHDYPVDIVLGWVQTQFYVTRFPDGRYQVLPTYWDMKANVWYDQSEGPIFGTGRKLDPKDQKYWANRGSTWNAVCSGCHGSQVEKNFDAASNAYRTTWNDLAINCEACHGPGSRHVEAWTRAGSAGRVDPGKDGLVKLKALPPERQVEACAKCHAAKTVIARGFQPGDRFLDYYQPAVPLNNKEFYSDGRNRMLNYNYIELIQSRCYLKSTLTCTTCHDPHGSGYYGDLKEPPETLDRLCLPCHTPMKAGLQEHTHHPAESAGSRCVACHMPYMHLGGRLDVRDHTISVPVPSATREFGIPNSCNDCHRDREPQWAADAIQKWFGDDQKARLNATAAFFFGHRRDPAATAALLRLFADKNALPPARRAAIPMILAQYDDPSLLFPLLPTLQDPKEDLLIRFWLTSAFASSSGPMTEQALLYAVTRPERSLRRMAGVELARRGVRPKEAAASRAIEEVAKEYEELVQGVRADVPEDHEYLGDIYLARGEKQKAMERYRSALQLNPDLPRAQISLGSLYAERKEVDQAAACFKAAADLLPGSPIPLFDLGTLNLQAGRPADAIPPLRRALEIDPRHAEARFSLAVAWVETRQFKPALDALREIVVDRPRNPMARYYLGRAYEGMGEEAQAAEAYRKALVMAPDLTEARQALATLLARSPGQRP